MSLCEPTRVRLCAYIARYNSKKKKKKEKGCEESARCNVEYAYDPGKFIREERDVAVTLSGIDGLVQFDTNVREWNVESIGHI